MVCVLVVQFDVIVLNLCNLLVLLCFVSMFFILGVVLGDFLVDGMVLWIWLVIELLVFGGGMLVWLMVVEWQLVVDEGMCRVVCQGLVMVYFEFGYVVYVELDGLVFGWFYWYCFIIGGYVSVVGCMCMLLVVMVVVDCVCFVVVGCQYYEEGYYIVW